MKTTSMMVPLFTKISEKGKPELVFLSRYYGEEELRKRLSCLGTKEWVDEILSTGIRLPKDEARRFTFDDETRITTQTNEKMWTTYREQDTIIIYSDGTFKKVTDLNKKKSKLRNDISRAISECNPSANLDRLAKRIEERTFWR